MTDDDGNTWRTFCDRAYFDLWAVQHEKRKDFYQVLHLQAKDEAEFVCQELNRLETLRQIITTDHESKESFINRVRKVLTEGQ